LTKKSLKILTDQSELGIYVVIQII
jgi:hypothetical protein